MVNIKATRFLKAPMNHWVAFRFDGLDIGPIKRTLCLRERYGLVKNIRIVPLTMVSHQIQWTELFHLDPGPRRIQPGDWVMLKDDALILIGNLSAYWRVPHDQRNTVSRF